MTNDYMEGVAWKVQKPRRRKSHSMNNTVYRENKTHSHKTISGVGIVSRLRRKNKK